MTGQRTPRLHDPSRFPDPRTSPGDEPLARSGDLEPDTLLDAYGHGIFPWPVGDRGVASLWWWSPDPRGVVVLTADGGLHVSRSLRRTLRRSGLTFSVDAAFDAVVTACAQRGEGTWITPAMRAAYGRLHDLGRAHSVEVWQSGTLVGGVYGVAVGGVFCGESMFHRIDDASKVALVCLTRSLFRAGFTLLDVQMWTPHLGSLGAVEMDRGEFLDILGATPEARLAPSRPQPVDVLAADVTQGHGTRDDRTSPRPEQHDQPRPR